MSEGRESPEPERQSGAQLHDTMGQGVHSKDKSSKQVEESSKSQTENLSSNPRGPMEDAVEKKFSKGPGNKTS
ncbi:uncharacterized protein LMH87_008856 [Akanthomyces muscarius]|uniref:Uncharacterized protein n=1 Tax=Akanthomyces muscarius TaxID=2231603 RepID=A0A9W8QH58_AKAMU|nr:uncharacterized protein LMH87_008856 [Akanthomyces muscarius]KAJ4158324.1 hypothetical protein LMH87_008856 [Akanthomyces muscarius]